MANARSLLLTLAAIAVALIAAPRAARAQSAEAEVLFRDGRRLLAEGQIAAACQKLEASEKLESSVGTLLNLADCRERNSQLATAWATFLKAAGAARRDRDRDRHDEAARRARILEPRLSYLTISVPAASQIDGLAITRNGAPLDPAQWNTSLPVDAGTYVVAAIAPGRDGWTQEIAIAEGQRLSVDVPRFTPVEELAPTPAPRGTLVDPWDGADVPPRRLPSAPPAPPAPRRLSTLRWIAIGAGTAGLAAIGTGVWRGLAAGDLASAADARCPTSSCDDAEGLRLSRDAERTARQANVLYAAGGAAIAGAAILWMVGRPRRADAAPIAIGPLAGGDRVGLALAGSF